MYLCKKILENMEGRLKLKNVLYINNALTPRSMYNIVQAIGKTIFGGVKVGFSNLLYQVKSIRFPPRLDIINEAIIGWRSKAIFQVVSIIFQIFLFVKRFSSFFRCKVNLFLFLDWSRTTARNCIT